ncbi:MAG: hypothetical protein IIB61_01995 [Planctomycetes bacterium]|nr:hypothetical protein [Planctomycetota bacterium]
MAVRLAGAVLGSGGHFVAKLQIPNEVKLGGFPLAFQALVGPFPAMVFTNVVVPVIR